MLKNLAIGLGIAVVVAHQAFAAGDPAEGEKVFNRICKACHNATEAKNKVGPYLQGVVGRKSGSAEGFNFSDAMKSAGLTWDEDTLNKYLTDPKGTVPKNKMAFAGLKKDDDRANVIAYLSQQKAQ